MRRAIDCRAELRACFGAGRAARRAIEQLKLQSHRRERRAQLMRGVRNERALSGECFLYAREQAIQFLNQRRDFGRQVFRRHRIEAVHIAPLHFASHSLQRPQPRSHDPYDGRAENRHEQQQRNHDSQRARPRKRLAHAQRLRHLNDAIDRLQSVDAPHLALKVHVRVTQHRAIDRRQPGARPIHAGAEQIPDLNHEIGIALRRRQLDSRRQ